MNLYWDVIKLLAEKKFNEKSQLDPHSIVHMAHGSGFDLGVNWKF
jgi:hypothetical protein